MARNYRNMRNKPSTVNRKPSTVNQLNTPQLVLSEVEGLNTQNYFHIFGVQIFDSGYQMVYQSSMETGTPIAFLAEEPCP